MLRCASCRRINSSTATFDQLSGCSHLMAAKRYFFQLKVLLQAGRRSDTVGQRRHGEWGCAKLMLTRIMAGAGKSGLLAPRCCWPWHDGQLGRRAVP
jgi:hypothetical protein